MGISACTNVVEMSAYGMCHVFLKWQFSHFGLHMVIFRAEIRKAIAVLSRNGRGNILHTSHLLVSILVRLRKENVALVERLPAH